MNKLIIEQWAKIFKKAIRPIENAIICIKMKQKTIRNKDYITFNIYEAPTEMLYGPSDGTIILFGFKTNIKTIIKNLDDTDIRFIIDDTNSKIVIKGIYQDTNINVIITDNADTDPLQKYDTLNDAIIDVPTNIKKLTN